MARVKMGVKEVDFRSYLPVKSYESASTGASFDNVLLKKAVKDYVDLAMVGVSTKDSNKALQFLSTQVHACVDKISTTFRIDGDAVQDELKKYCQELISKLPVVEPLNPVV